MANTVVLTGFVADEPQVKDNVGKFQISFFDGKDKDGNGLYSYQTIKVYDFSALPEKGDLVLITGRLHKFKYNEKYYDEIRCNYDGWAKIQRRPKEEQSDEPIEESSDTIPF